MLTCLLKHVCLPVNLFLEEKYIFVKCQIKMFLFFPLKFILGQSPVAYDLEFPFIECLENSSWLPSCWNEWTMNLQYLQEHGDSWWSLKAAG